MVEWTSSSLIWAASSFLFMLSIADNITLWKQFPFTQPLSHNCISSLFFFQRQEINTEKYWRYEFPALMSSREIEKYVILSVEPILAKQRASAKRRFGYLSWGTWRTSCCDAVDIWVLKLWLFSSVIYLTYHPTCPHLFPGVLTKKWDSWSV